VGKAWGDGGGFLLGLAEKHGELLDGGHGDVAAVVSRKKRLALEVEEEDGGRHGERLVACPGRGLRSGRGGGSSEEFEMDGRVVVEAGTSRAGWVARFPHRLVKLAYLMEPQERAWGVDVLIAQRRLGRGCRRRALSLKLVPSFTAVKCEMPLQHRNTQRQPA